MSLFDKLFPKHKKHEVEGYGYRTFTDLSPSFTRFNGGVYEQELTRAAISCIARAVSKLKPEVQGESKPWVNKMIRTQPNENCTWPQFLKRVSTIYEVDDTVFIAPVLDSSLRTVGIYPLLCEFAEIVEYKGEPWVRFHFATGDTAAIELSRVCILSRFQYENEFFGEPNCLTSTLDLISYQNQAQGNAIRNNAKVRFIGRINGQVREEDMEKKRQRFVESQLTSDNDSGLLVYDGTFADIKQITPQSYVIDTAEMQRIEENVFNYFGVNKAVLQNSYDEDVWAAFYEGRIEPFAVELGEGLNRMLFTKRELAKNRIDFSSNRLAYASMASKRNMARDMLDRGVMTLNEAREILQLPPIPGGDVNMVRGEYTNAAKLHVLTTSNSYDIDRLETQGDAEYAEQLGKEEEGDC